MQPQYFRFTIIFLGLLMTACGTSHSISTRETIHVRNSEINPLLPPERVIEEVNKWIGVKYRYGGNSSEYVDCSAFVRNVYWQLGWILPRTTAEQIQYGYTVSKDDMYIGDLIFFDTNGNGRVSHVGIYLGDNRFAHSSKSRGVTTNRLNQTYYVKTFLCVKRMVW